jgi:hypothetical protein
MGRGLRAELECNKRLDGLVGESGLAQGLDGVSPEQAEEERRILRGFRPKHEIAARGDDDTTFTAHRAWGISCRDGNFRAIAAWCGRQTRNARLRFLKHLEILRIHLADGVGEIWRDIGVPSL